MRVLRFTILVLSLALMLTACQTEPTVEPETNADASEFATTCIDPEAAAWEIMRAVNYPVGEDVKPPDAGAEKTLMNLLDFEREDLGDGIAHYSFTLRVGWGDHDQVMLHRVVKERQPYHPIRTRKNIFMQHGDGVGFVKFLFGPAAPSVDDDHAVAIHLAEGDVDVWGIDQNWVLVAPETDDFAFMADWGMDNQISNLRIALGVARFVRLFSGGGFGTMNLLGYSSGGATGYAYINDEAGRPACERHVGGYVCADMAFKFSPEFESARQLLCDGIGGYEERFAVGDYGEFIPFVMVGELAVFDPDSDSPLVPGFTNEEVAYAFGAATFWFSPYIDWFHYWGGSFDPDTGMPVTLDFTSYDAATDFMRTACTWEALRFIYDIDRTVCDEEDVPWDDNLAAVEIPILLLEPAGGFGRSADHTAGLLGSTDIEVLATSLLPPDQAVMDFGHIDIWTADQAPQLIWQPLLEWVNAHTPVDGHHFARMRQD